MSAFLSMSILAISENPPVMAYDRGAAPAVSLALTSAPPAMRKAAISGFSA